MAEDAASRLTDRYNAEALAYRTLWAPVLQIAGGRLVRALRDDSVRTIIDVGSGVGSLLPDLRTVFPSACIVATDRSSGMLALAPAGFPRCVMDAGELALADKSIDMVVMAFMLFHLEQPAAGLLEARRILRSGGQVGTLTWVTDLESTATQVWTDCLGEFGAPEPDPTTQTRHEPLNTPAKLERLLADAGFNSARAWEEELAAQIDLEHLLSLKTTMGSSRPRFDALDASARAACLAEARRRLQTLSPADFLARGRVVFAIGGVAG